MSTKFWVLVLSVVVFGFLARSLRTLIQASCKLSRRRFVPLRLIANRAFSRSVSKFLCFGSIITFNG